MKTIRFSILLAFLPVCLFSQAMRVDPTPLFTTASNIPAGANAPILTVPGVTVNVCAFPGNAVPCTNYATTYTSPTAATSCPTNAPITLASTTTCVSTADAQGNFGFWLLPGTYSYTATVGGASYGPFPITVNGPLTTNITSFGAVCNGVTNDHDAFVAAEASAFVNIAIPTNSLCIVTPQITLTKYYVGGRVSLIGFNQARNDININTLPSFGPQWTLASGAVTSITVSAGVATVHMTVNPNSPSVIAINGVEAAQALNTAAVAVTSSTSSTIVFSTSAANGTYTDSGMIIDDRTNVGFQGDNSRTVENTHSTIAAGVNRQAINNQYYNYTMNPHFTEFDMNSGYSGISAHLTAGSSIGATTISVNNATDLTIGKIINIDSNSALETRKVSGVSGTTITLDLALANNHSINAMVSLGSRTADASYYTEMNVGALGGGDNYGFWANVNCGSAARPGQIHPFQNGTCGILGGSTNATANENYLQASEIQISDDGFDAFVVGDVRGFVRNNNTAANFQEWIAEFWQSTGSKLMDAGLVLAGNYNIGLDLSRQVMGATNDAIQLPQNGRIYFDIGYTGDASGVGTPLYGNTINTQTYMFYDISASAYKFFQGGTDALTFSANAAIFSGGISAGKGYQATLTNFSLIGTCNSGADGSTRAINDSNTAIWGATAAGGGANHVYVYCDGTNWTVMGK